MRQNFRDFAELESCYRCITHVVAMAPLVEHIKFLAMYESVKTQRNLATDQ